MFGSYTGDAHRDICAISQLKPEAAIPDPLLLFDSSLSDFTIKNSEEGGNMTGMTGDGATNAVLINAVRSSEELPATTCIPSEQGRDKDKGMGKDGMIQSDASSAVNAALSVLGTTHQKASRKGLLSRWRDQRDMDSKPLKRTTQEYGDTWAVESVEVTPETGRVNKRRLSEDDKVSPFPGSPDGDEDSSSEPRVGNAESSESLLRPGNAAAARARAQPFQGTPPAQARLSNSQPFSHQSAPYSSPANTSLPSLESYIGYSPPRPPNAVQRAQHQGSTTPIGIGRYASGPTMPVSGVSIPMNQGSFGSTGIGVGPPGAPPFSQAPSQTSSESRLHTGAPTYRHGTIIRGHPAVGVTPVYRNQQGGPAPVSPFPHPGASLSSSNARMQAQEEYRTSNRGFSEEMGVRGSPALPRRSASDLRHPRSLQPGPPINLPPPQHTMPPQSLEGPGPSHHARDAVNRQIRQPTTADVDRYRMDNPHMRDHPTPAIKTCVLMSRIMYGRREARPHTDLPTVTAEEMQEFRLQYRSTPVLLWPREYEISDTHATIALQALKLRGLSLTELGLVTQPTNPTQSATDTPTLRGSGHPGGAAQPGHDGHAPEYLLDRFIERYEATRTHEGFPPNPAASRARAMLAAGRGFQPRDDDAHGGALASGPVRSIVIQIDDDPADFGITEITCRNARGETIVSRSARRPAQNNGNNSLALNTEIIDIHIEDDLVGAAESTTPAEKFRRLMNSSPTR